MSLTGPHYRATTEPVPLFNANWQATSVEAEHGHFAMAFRFAPLLAVVDSLGAVVHARRVGLEDPEPHLEVVLLDRALKDSLP